MVKLRRQNDVTHTIRFSAVIITKSSAYVSPSISTSKGAPVPKDWDISQLVAAFRNFSLLLLRTSFRSDYMVPLRQDICRAIFFWFLDMLLSLGFAAVFSLGTIFAIGSSSLISNFTLFRSCVNTELFLIILLRALSLVGNPVTGLLWCALTLLIGSSLLLKTQFCDPDDSIGFVGHER